MNTKEAKVTQIILIFDYVLSMESIRELFTLEAIYIVIWVHNWANNRGHTSRLKKTKMISKLSGPKEGGGGPWDPFQVPP